MRDLLVLALLGAGLHFPLHAQAPADRGPLNRQLPKWLTLGISQRIRMETWGDVVFEPSDDDTFVVNRLQVRADVRPRQGFRVFAEAMDSRVRGLEPGKSRPAMRDPVDLRQAFVQVGDIKSGFWDLTVGRQELAFGEERTLGINEWANLPRSWDAVRLGLHHGVDRVDVFASTMVVVDPDAFNWPSEGSNLHGIYAQLRSPLPGHVLEPHLLWRTRPSVVDERGNVGDSDIYTLGLRIADDHNLAVDYAAELEGQWGDYAQDKHRAYLAMGQLGYTFLNAPWAPRLMMEYSFASGDDESGDGRSHRYDQLFARAHRIWGILDQVGGRNSKIWQESAQFHPAPRWQLRLDHLSYWLANPNDSLYRHNGQLFLPIAPGNTATYIGDEVEGQITWRPAPEIAIGAGFGKLFSGAAVERNSHGGSPVLGYIFAELAL